MKLNELQSVVKIKWNKFYVCREGTSSMDKNNFELTPYEFLEFAKQDYKSESKKGFVGTLTNSKRAIDCQIDWIISYLGYEHLNFNEQRYPNVINVMNYLEETEKLNKDYSIKLRFIQALEIAPTFLISEIRKIRNKLEHEYILPTKEKAKEALEIAELFINATHYVLFDKFATDYYIQNEYDSEEQFIKRPSYSIRFDLYKCEVEIICMPEKKENNIEVKVESSEKEFVYFLKAAISHNFYYLVKAFGCDIDREYVNYAIEMC